MIARRDRLDDGFNQQTRWKCITTMRGSNPVACRGGTMTPVGIRLFDFMTATTEQIFTVIGPGWQSSLLTAT